MVLLRVETETTASNALSSNRWIAEVVKLFTVTYLFDIIFYLFTLFCKYFYLFTVFENSEKMILVMEYCSGGELYDYLSQKKVLQEDEARRSATHSFCCLPQTFAFQIP